MFKSKKVWISAFIIIMILIFFLGFSVGVMQSNHFDINSKLSIDGIISSTVGLIGIIVAAIVIPAIIQPMFSKQKTTNSFTCKNIECIIDNLNNAIDILDNIYNSPSKKVSVSKRKALVDCYSQITNYALIVSNHSKDIQALDKFKEEIYTPLTNAEKGFAVDVVPGVTINESMYLSSKSGLKSLVYKLIEIEYNIN